MKNTIKLMMIGLGSLSLIGCNTLSNQDVGTLTGGVAGGILGSTIGGGSGKIVAVAAGAIAGAYIGGSIGQQMDREDRQRMRHALEDNSIGQPAYWRNANTGTTYKVVPTKNVTIGDNRYCREYRSMANIGGKKQQVYGTACRQPDGSWQAVNDE